MKYKFVDKGHLNLRCLFLLSILFVFAFSAYSQEIKAAWLVRYDWKTENQVDDILNKAIRHGITDIFIQIRGRGDAYYRKSYEPYAVSFENSHDRLLEFLTKSRQINIRIHAWINVFLVGSGRDKPFPKNHILSLHPEWVIKDTAGKSLLEYDYRKYEAKKLEGIYLDPNIDGVLSYHVKLINHILKNYPFDGIHLDYFRLPSKEFYDLNKISPIRTSEKLGLFLAEVKKNIKKYRINAVLSVAVKSDLLQARNEYGQDWADWLNKKYIDYTVMMNYTSNNSLFLRQMKKIPAAIKPNIVVGISLYDKQIDQVKWQVQSAFKLGFSKISYFSMKYLK